MAFVTAREYVLSPLTRVSSSRRCSPNTRFVRFIHTQYTPVPLGPPAQAPICCIYLCGGSRRDGHLIRRQETLPLTKGAWKRLPPLPSMRYHLPPGRAIP